MAWRIVVVVAVACVLPRTNAFTLRVARCVGGGRLARATVTMSDSPEDRLAALEKAMQELQVEGASPEDRLAALEKDLMSIRDDMRVTQAGSSKPPPSVQDKAPDPLPPPPPAPQPPKEEFAPFPSPAAIGVEGQRCVIIFYAHDGIPKVETLLETFEDDASEYAACGCAMVAVRRSPQDAGDMRKVKAYEERFPSLNFIDGLETLADIRGALGIGDDWIRTLYYDPVVALLEPDGGMRYVLSHRGLGPLNIAGNVMRELHVAVPRAGATVSNAEAEAQRQALWNENAQWAEVLKEDESLRQPTRSWFDGLGKGGASKRPLLAGVDAAALPEAIDKYLAEGDEEDEEEVILLSKDGVKAPAWYAQAKRAAEKKQEEERLLWNGTAPSATPGPLPLGPKGARLAPMSGYARKALQEAQTQQQSLLQGFFKYREAEFRSLTGDEAAASDLGDGADATQSGAAPTPRTATTESALLRAEMLALGLSRSATSTQSTRRLRLLRELEACVKELQAEGYNDRKVLAQFKEQIRLSYASAPPEFVAEARKANPFNEGLPRLTLDEIAGEFVEIAGSGIEDFWSGLEKGIANVDFDSLDPGRKRGPREKGNRIEIKKPTSPDE